MTDLPAVHDRLTSILAPYRDTLVATKDGPGGLSLEIPGLEGKPWGYVAGTRVGKRYVSFYLMPIYASPELGATISEGLRKRKQGKACFNFSTIDEGLMAELAELTRRGVEGYSGKAMALAAQRAR
jgi:hypothetical protein